MARRDVQAAAVLLVAGVSVLSLGLRLLEGGDLVRGLVLVGAGTGVLLVREALVRSGGG